MTLDELRKEHEEQIAICKDKPCELCEKEVFIWSVLDTIIAENARLQARVAELEGQLEFAEECLRWKSARIAELEAVAQAAKKLNAEYKVLGELGDAPTDYHDLQNELCADLYQRLMSAVDALEAAECAAKQTDEKGVIE